MHQGRSGARPGGRVGGLALATACALLFVLPASATAQPTTTGGPRVSENFKLGDDTRPARAHDVPGVAVDPADPRHIVTVDVEMRSSECEHHVTFDGGATWSTGRLRAPEGFPTTELCPGVAVPDGYAAMDGSVTFGSGQNVYVAFSAPRGTEGNSTLVAKSTDGGRTFAPAVVAIQGGPNNEPRYIRPKVAVQRRPGQPDRVYAMAWGLTTPAVVTAGQRRTVVARSDDAGASFLAPVDASPSPSPPNSTREPTKIAVDADGWVYVGWRTQFEVPGQLVVARSEDGGATWTRTLVRNLTGSRESHPELAVDPRPGKKNVYVVYIEPPLGTANADPDIFFQRSVDGGTTWSAPRQINDDEPPPRNVQQRSPWVDVAPDGRVDVVWHDRRNPYKDVRLGDTYYTFSADEGVTFSANRRVTDRSVNLDIGMDRNAGTTSFYPPASASLGPEGVLVAWADSREGGFETEAQDIYGARVRPEAGGALPVRRLPETGPSGLSVSLSQLSYPGGSEILVTRSLSRVVVANEGDAGAALAAGVLARDNSGPLLLSPSQGLPARVRSEVSRMQPVGAFVVGNEAALSSTVVDDLVRAGVPRDRIVRLAGDDPPATARAVAVSMDTRNDAARAAGTPAFPAAVIVNPATSEAYAASALAAALRLPVLFVERDAVPEATSEALAELNITDTLVVGSETAVSEAVVAQLTTEGRFRPPPTGTSKRLGGTDVYSTSEAVAVESRARGLPVNVVYVADGARPMDGAVLGAAVARLGGLMLLEPSADPAAAEASLDRLQVKAMVDRLVVARSGISGLGGYRLVASDGGIFAFGDAPFLGSTGSLRLNQPVVGMAATPSGDGYWLVAADGGIFAFGDAAFSGSTGGEPLDQPVVGMAAHPSGNGYWLVARDGSVFAFGEARFRGATRGIRLNQPIVGMASTPSGNGYWLVAADGAIFAFGDARFRGSTGDIRLNQPIVGMASTPSGNGYWLVAADGGIFAFGDAGFFGSTGAMRLNRPVVGMAPAPLGQGYWLVAADGGIFAFGNAPFLGSTGSMRLNRPVVGMAAG